jgi:LysM repeat protein
LARKYRVDLTELKAANNLATDLIFPGQELVLPNP